MLDLWAFSSVVEAIIAEDYYERKPCACRWTSTKALPVSMYRKRLDRLTSNDIYWIPYSDHRVIREFKLISCFSGHIWWGLVVVIHRPERVVRQFRYVQTVLPHSRFKIMLRRYWWQMDAFLWLPCSGGPDLSCAWTMCTRLHGLVLHNFASIHGASTTRVSSHTSTCHPRWHICRTRYALVPDGDSSYGGSTCACTFSCEVA